MGIDRKQSNDKLEDRGQSARIDIDCDFIFGDPPDRGTKPSQRCNDQEESDPESLQNRRDQSIVQSFSLFRLFFDIMCSLPDQ